MSILPYISSESAQIIVAGIAGGVVRVVTLKETRWRATGSLLVGGIMALYAGPVALPVVEAVVGVLHVDPASAATLSGFLMGLGGITFAQAILRIYDAFGLKSKPDNRGDRP